MKIFDLADIQNDSVLHGYDLQQKQVIKFYQGLRRTFSDKQPHFQYIPGMGFTALWHNPIPTELTMVNTINFESAQTDKFTLLNGNVRHTISIYYNLEKLTHIPAQHNSVIIYINPATVLFFPLNGESYRLKCISRQIHYDHYDLVQAYGLPVISPFFPPTWGPRERLFIQELGDYDDVNILLASIWYELTYLCFAK